MDHCVQVYGSGTCNEFNNCSGRGSCLNGLCVCDPGIIGLNCSFDLACRFWNANMSDWWTNDCYSSPPPSGKYDGFLHCNCMSPGTFGGTIEPWYPPILPAFFNVFGALDIPQGPPQLIYPFNGSLVALLGGILFFNILGLIWAKFRVHRRAMLRARAIAERRKKIQDFTAKERLKMFEAQQEDGVTALAPTEDALAAQGLSGPKKPAMGNLLNWTNLLAKAVAMPKESIQERVPISALVEQVRNEAAAELTIEPPKSPDPKSSPSGTLPALEAPSTFSSRPQRSWPAVPAALTFSSLRSPAPSLFAPALADTGNMSDLDDVAEEEYEGAEFERPGLERGSSRLQREIEKRKPEEPDPGPAFLIQQRIPNYNTNALSSAMQPFKTVTGRQQLPPLQYVPSAPANEGRSPAHAASRLNLAPPNVSPPSLLGSATDEQPPVPERLAVLRAAPEHRAPPSPPASPPSGPETATVKIKIPPGGKPGMKMNVQGPDGQEHTVVIPPDKKAGDMFDAEVPLLHPDEEEPSPRPPRPPRPPPVAPRPPPVSQPTEIQQSRIHVGALLGTPGGALGTPGAAAPVGSQKWCLDDASRQTVAETLRQQGLCSVMSAAPAAMSEASNTGGIVQARIPIVQPGMAAAPKRAGAGPSVPVRPPARALGSLTAMAPAAALDDAEANEDSEWRKKTPHWRRGQAVHEDVEEESASHGASRERQREGAYDSPESIRLAGSIGQPSPEMRRMAPPRDAFVHQPPPPPQPPLPLQTAAPAAARTGTPPSRPLTPSTSARRLFSLAGSPAGAPGAAVARVQTPPSRWAVQQPPRAGAPGAASQLSPSELGQDELERACMTEPRSKSTPPCSSAPASEYARRAPTPPEGLHSRCRMPVAPSASKAALQPQHEHEPGDEETRDPSPQPPRPPLRMSESGAPGTFRTMTPPGSRIKDWKNRRLGALIATEKEKAGAAAVACESGRAELQAEEPDEPPVDWFLQSEGDSTSASPEGPRSSGMLTLVRNVNEGREKFTSASDLSPDRLARRVRVNPSPPTPGTMAARNRRFFGMNIGLKSAALVLQPGQCADSTGPPVMADGKLGWKGAGKRLKLADTLSKPNKKPPPPSKLWQVIRSQHTLIAAFFSPSKGSEDQQLRDTQLVQAFFNTLLLELAVVHIIASRMTNYATAMSAVQVAVNGILTGFLCTVGTVICKQAFRWGNVTRRRTRKGPPRIVEFCRWLGKEMSGKETLFHGLQTVWYEYRTKGVKRAPKKALQKRFVVLRNYAAWFLNASALVASVVLTLLYGVDSEYVKFETSMYAYAIAMGESFLLVEPIVIGLVFAFPRAIDRMLLPQDDTPKDGKRRFLGRGKGKGDASTKPMKGSGKYLA